VDRVDSGVWCVLDHFQMITLARYRWLRWLCVGLLAGYVVFGFHDAFASVPGPPVMVSGPFAPYPNSFSPTFKNPGTDLFNTLLEKPMTGAAAGELDILTSGVAKFSWNSAAVSIPVVETAALSGSAIAVAARMTLRLAGPIGAALTIAEIANDLKDSGYVTCPPPDFFCKPAGPVPGVQPSGMYNSYVGTAAKYQDLMAKLPCIGWDTFPVGNASFSSRCIAGPMMGSVVIFSWNPGGACPSGMSFDWNGTQCFPNVVPPPTPIDDPTLESNILSGVSNGVGGLQRLYDAMRGDQAALGPNAVPESVIIPGNTPATVTASPKSTAPVVTGTTQATNPDGSTSTTTTSQQTTVTPVTTGNTVNTINTSYRTDVTTTTTTINNTTGATTTTINNTTTTKVDPGAGSSSGASDPPPDFCAVHPDLNICNNPTAARACENGIATVSCTGDAVICEQLKTLEQARCDAMTNNTDQAKFGQKLIDGGDTATLPTPQNGPTVNVPLVSDAEGGGGACFVDKSFSFGGHTLVVPFSKVCEPMLPLRYGLMIMAMLFSFRMLSGVIFQV
jgi:hypothetical protein